MAGFHLMLTCFRLFSTAQVHLPSFPARLLSDFVPDSQFQHLLRFNGMAGAIRDQTHAH